MFDVALVLFGLFGIGFGYFDVVLFINIGLHTRMYFPEETSANAEDPLLARIEHKDRLATLIAAKEGSVYTFDVHLQGDRETVFLDI